MSEEKTAASPCHTHMNRPLNGKKGCHSGSVSTFPHPVYHAWIRNAMPGKIDGSCRCKQQTWPYFPKTPHQRAYIERIAPWWYKYTLKTQNAFTGHLRAK